MAERRMFAKTIIDSDDFLDMPTATQALYFHLSMRADDDGFVNSPKKIIKMIGATLDDLSTLSTRKFIIPFESGVVVIKHWKIHNYIQKDRYNETKYKDEKASLSFDENNAYTQTARRRLGDGSSTKRQPTVNQPVSKQYPTCIQPVSKLDTQDRLGKDRLGKDRLDSSRYLNTEDYKYLCDTIGQNDTDYYLERVKAFLKKKPDAIFDVKATILKWHREDRKGELKSEKSGSGATESCRWLDDVPKGVSLGELYNKMADNLSEDEL